MKFAIFQTPCLDKGLSLLGGFFYINSGDFRKIENLSFESYKLIMKSVAIKSGIKIS